MVLPLRGWNHSPVRRFARHSQEDPRPLRLGDLQPDLLALQLRPVEELDRAVGLVAIDLDEGEAVQHADIVDRLLGEHGALAQGPAQVLLVDAAALTAVDEELDRLAVVLRALILPAAVLRDL